MDERELPSDSDESDADYVPSGAESNAPSEEESDGEEENDQGDSDAEPADSGKRKHKGTRGKKKKKVKSARTQKPVEEVEEDATEEKPALNEEDEKKRVDSLWSDFLKDTGGPLGRPKPNLTNGSNKQESSAPKADTQKAVQKENKVTITKLFEFAGEEVRVTKEVDADSAEARLSTKLPLASSTVRQGAGLGRGMGGGSGGGLKGLSSVLGQLGKKSKLGTLEKSKMDWDRYKRNEGLEEEIQLHNRGKDGYLEKQDFLQRTDLRQFEIEKELRTTRRSHR